MKRCSLLLVLVLLLGMLSGCGGSTADTGDVLLATTYPVYYLAQRITEGVPSGELTVDLMVTEQVSCLHDYSLTTVQMKKVDRASLIFLSGAGMEEFMESALHAVPETRVVDCSDGIDVLPGEEEGEPDPHIWLDPQRFARQGENMAEALISAYPEYAELLRRNTDALTAELLAFKKEAVNTLKDLPTRDLVTFHDGFAYFAEAFALTPLAAIEVEDGASPSAREIREVTALIRENRVPVIFEEAYSGGAAHLSAATVASEAPCGLQKLDMFMSADGSDYFQVMRQNIDTIQRYLTWD